MTNPDRLAQALRNIFESDWSVDYGEEARAALAEYDALASLAPAAVDGEPVAWDAYTALRWIADRYSDRKSTNECASDAYEMACVARAALVPPDGDAVLELCNAADDVGVNHFDTDDMPADVERLQQATLAVRRTHRPAQVAALTAQCEGKQAKIDALMLEYCPDEMTQEQFEEWGRNQRRCSPEEEAAINESLRGGTEGEGGK